jgi:hypothetical protein
MCAFFMTTLVLGPTRHGIRVQNIFFEPCLLELLDQVLFRCALNAAITATSVDVVSVREHVTQYPANPATGRVGVSESIDVAVADGFSERFNTV